MPVSEAYFLQYLLERTNTEPPDINWRQASPAGYWAAVAGMEEAVKERMFRRVLFQDCGSLAAMGQVSP